MAQATAAAGTVMVLSSNAGTTFADIASTGVRWWLQAYLPADRTLAEPLLARAVDAGAEAIVLTVDTPVVATKYAAGDQVVWDVVDPELLRVNFDPDYEDAPGAEKATDLGPHDLGLARRADRAAGRREGGAAPRRRPPLRAGRRRRRLGVQPRRPPARPGGVHRDVPGRPSWPWSAGAGLRRRRDPQRSRRARRPGARRRRGVPGPAAAYALVDGVGGVGRMHTDLREETVEAFRLAGCRTVADTRGIAAEP